MWITFAQSLPLFDELNLLFFYLPLDLFFLAQLYHYNLRYLDAAQNETAKNGISKGDTRSGYVRLKVIPLTANTPPVMKPAAI